MRSRSDAPRNPGGGLRDFSGRRGPPIPRVPAPPSDPSLPMPLRSLLLSLVCLLALALAPAAARAATPVIGYAAAVSEMFCDPLFPQLGLRDSRIVVEWDTFRSPDKT